MVLPNNDNNCGWINTLPFRKANKSLSENFRAKWLIIGAGYTGLSAALTLAEQLPDDEIMLIDANAAGEGASSRNSGYLVDSTLNDGHLSDSGLTAYKSKYQLNLHAIAVVKALVNKYNIVCDWHECGKYHATADLASVNGVVGASEKKLRQFSSLLDSLAIDNQFIKGDDLADKLGTNFYQMAVKTKGGVMLQPAALARGMIAALPSNVSLYENTSVTDITQGSPHRITCQSASGENVVLADNVIVAVNGFMPSLGLKKNRVFPLLLTASLTRPLSKNEQKNINCVGEWGVLSVNAMGATVRYTQDHRLMIRNTVEVSRTLQLTSAELAHRQKVHLMGLKKRFAFLPDDIFEYCWSGITCISANNANIFEKYSTNFWLSGCYNGGGIGLATLYGQQIALQAIEESQPQGRIKVQSSSKQIRQQIYQRPKASWLPPQPFLNLGVKAKLTMDRLKVNNDN